jgi:hypothetical protein
MKVKFILSLLILFFTTNVYSSYYEPNADIKQYLDNITNIFVKISSYAQVNPDNIPSNLFSDLANDFSVLKNKLPQTNPNFKVVYENCEISSRELAN